MHYIKALWITILLTLQVVSTSLPPLILPLPFSSHNFTVNVSTTNS